MPWAAVEPSTCSVSALESLGQKARAVYPTEYWLEYLLACRRIAAEVGVPIRTLDKALWQASKENGLDG